MDATPAATALSRNQNYCDPIQESQTLDSGYGTQSTTPNSQLAESFPHKSTAVENKARPVPLAFPSLNGLAEFDKSVDDNTLSRFSHVHTQIEKPLLAYIRSKLPGRKYRPIALRLMILGQNEDDAKPCIVVFCPEEQCKRVRKFFNKSSIAALCQPEDKALPSFKVFVLTRALETKHADEDIDILIPIIEGHEGYTAETYCGAPIIIRKPSGMERRCTFGGIIRTVSCDGDTKLYGLTVGHVLLDDPDDCLAVGDEPLHNCGLQLSDSESENEPDEAAEEGFEETESLPAIDNSQLVLGDLHDMSTSWVSPELCKIGRISKMATPETSGWDVGAYYDWALIEMEQQKPNRIRSRKISNGKTQGKGIRSGDLLGGFMTSCSSGKRQSVTLLSGSERLKRGTLSPLPSRLLLSPGNAFVYTLVLRLDDGQEIQDGDSGSWVVNEATLEVYGYVVAADSFGAGHVIPLYDAFRSIGAALRLRSISLATTVDMSTDKLVGHGSVADGPPHSHNPAPTMTGCLPDSGYSSGSRSAFVSPSIFDR